MNRPLAIVAACVSLLAVLLALQGYTHRMVDAQGQELHMVIRGNGPAVVFESGLGAELDYWQRTQSGASTFATTVAYDRAGYGSSRAGPLPRDGARIADELHAALQNAGVAPPYVLVGHSLGGLYTRIYAARFPQEVTALVLVDPTRDDEFATTMSEAPGNSEYDAIPATLRQARDAELPPGLPVYLISAMGAQGAPWFTPADAQDLDKLAAARRDDLAAHSAWIARIPNGELIVTENSGHNVPVEEPALVVATIRRALAEAATLREDAD